MYTVSVLQLLRYLVVGRDSLTKFTYEKPWVTIFRDLAFDIQRRPIKMFQHLF